MEVARDVTFSSGAGREHHGLVGQFPGYRTAGPWNGACRPHNKSGAWGVMVPLRHR